MSKYMAKKVEAYGRTFDSKKEAARYAELLLMERSGQIYGLECQKKYVLIEAQREASSEVYKRGRMAGHPKPGKVIEKEVAYYADFYYYDRRKGREVVEDVKGYKRGTAYAVFSIKRKLMLHIYGIRIDEI